MSRSSTTFARLLTVAVHRIRLEESTSVEIVQDELGYTLGREGGTAIEYWRKGHIPASSDDVERLARELCRRGGLATPAELEEFLRSASYAHANALCRELLPQHPASTTQPTGSIATAHAVLAPFIVGLPITHPRQFFGRERELKRIFGVLGRFPLQNVAIVGPKRGGKTSLLHYLRSVAATPPSGLRPGQRGDWLPHPERYRWVFVDFHDARMRRREHLLRYLLLEMGIASPGACTLETFMEAVSRELRAPAVILMDEIGGAIAAPELDMEFWWALRSLCSNQTGGNMAFVLTASETPAHLAQLSGKPSPFFNIFGHLLRLGPLAEAAAHELVASSPLPFDAVDIAWIVEQSCGWPAPLQLLCVARLQALEDGEVGDGWRAEALRRLEPLRHLLAEPWGLP